VKGGAGEKIDSSERVAEVDIRDLNFNDKPKRKRRI
jgi:hypothetical protein